MVIGSGWELWPWHDRDRFRSHSYDHGHGHGCSHSHGSCGQSGCIRIVRIVILALQWWWQYGKLTNDQCIFMLIVLDPQLKLCYYEEHDWEKKYIDKAKETVA